MLGTDRCRSEALRAGCGGRRVEPRSELIAKGEEELSELVALREAEAGKQLVLGVPLSLRRALELAFPGARQGDEVGPLSLPVGTSMRSILPWERTVHVLPSGEKATDSMA